MTRFVDCEYIICVTQDHINHINPLATLSTTKFKVEKVYILLTQRGYVGLKKNDYFPIQQ